MQDLIFRNQKFPRLASHKIVAFDPVLVCRQHPAWLVELYCHQCNQVICEECLFEVHLEHNVEDIQTVAAASRQKREEYSKRLKAKNVTLDSIQEIDLSKTALNLAKSRISDGVQKTKQALHELDI